ncbi:hypothetical protein [Phenylobacterium sp.]|jgi:hypothetical protein|uniref:hypothetical protein n=1 Tax=Phenylobacterium sp. TaxID=1871053 RepID=UPI002F958139
MSNGQDPRITDLRRYRKARERARRQPPPRPPNQSQSLLGGRKNAGPILVLVVLVLFVLWLGPTVAGLIGQIF